MKTHSLSNDTFGSNAHCERLSQSVVIVAAVTQDGIRIGCYMFPGRSAIRREGVSDAASVLSGTRVAEYGHGLRPVNVPAPR